MLAWKVPVSKASFETSIPVGTAHIGAPEKIPVGQGELRDLFLRNGAKSELETFGQEYGLGV